MSEQLSILVSGMLAGDPHQGGASWAVLQYLLGLRRLGHRVTFLEPVPGVASRAPLTAILQYFRKVVAEFELDDCAALMVDEADDTIGISRATLTQRALDADVLLNISGLLRDSELLDQIPTRVYLDLDPAFNQIWTQQGEDCGFDGHTHFVTVGQKVGADDCAVPTLGRNWIKTLPPVVLNEWIDGDDSDNKFFTTVGNWRSYGSVEHNGVSYGQKCHSLRDFWPLPSQANADFELAFGIHPDEATDLAALNENGWKLVDPVERAGTPTRYRDYIHHSKAEFGIAKSGYVKSNCGWFSDRSACYLAARKPVLAQATGFDESLPSGEGLLSFATIADAVAGVEAINADYGKHSRAACELAHHYFDSDRVLTSLLDNIGAQP